ncbi:potassium-transporting ATPase subunit C [Nakamurella flavida]|uniref:Potassium-transporting ATPase KdpC subunit n=1 Tax=Nakamurella flavida TaxID=363630 RepID=A0A938YN63_9ACTN|nr:potassium-transporting ATPase subunit C [Nakamurella flavida]MBM9477626.1 potassium-transporting ATPase subunit C [Nakamurella flavida]MDP9779175.1 K+-transporting ATPase ATPase C chain [Nakamurella flavida]
MRITSALRQLGGALRVLLLLTVVLGVLYPAFVWGASRLGTAAAEGAPLRDSNGCVVGSELIGVDPQVPAGTPDPYFHLRLDGDPTADDTAVGALTPGDPSAADANDMGPNNDTLLAFVQERRQVIADREGVDPAAVPADAVTGSASSIDPQISPAYATLQVARVARVTGLPTDRVQALVDEHTQGRQLGFLGEERVDVPALNVALGLTAPTCTG